LSVSPGTLNLGNLKVGDPTQARRVIVRASKPFKVLAVEGLGDDIEADLPPTAAQQQFLTIKFRPTKAGELRRQLKIKTDLETDAPLTVTVEGVVEP
jgi:hypothetical protein